MGANLVLVSEVEMPAVDGLSRGEARELYGRSGLRGLRLTRRGKLLLWTMACALGLILGVVLGDVATADSFPQAVEVQSHFVAKGETLWEIALSINPGIDTRDVVADIVDLNGFSDASIQAGSVIYLPVYPG